MSGYARLRLHQGARRAAKADRAEAEAEAAEVRGWVCQSCDTMIEDETLNTYCRSCAAYWRDVEAGLFDD